ncbi:uncharacterized protein PHALS_15456 [Plasmopara halstedii]|uniref:Uncharacterized protein n=1 Tax=Plasmopara halstedii TaxID=4781 RepID=A0A0P1AHA9_PLAHL|nr:uncharacterized protein PHALS_15456 [Plasmopara halstedii]CEG40550.1 hypothetical protein PHALS_15456 [Plasmopara halstedii]|eukprot:XP_024576919.1 hypothetical protein PHALS_15456 [Plasmopara halstedii]
MCMKQNPRHHSILPSDDRGRKLRSAQLNVSLTYTHSTPSSDMSLDLGRRRSHIQAVYVLSVHAYSHSFLKYPHFVIA